MIESYTARAPALSFASRRLSTGRVEDGASDG